ncbi:glycosyltransferase [Halorubrum sp. JWXQ-INN 858]|uniref:glycosyltransferase family 4 protein n=1 Tax=Halorubrum sp. JWXQ-INN 858 TaxID=2690782 RepID=UPI001359BAC9|nr:glycosyltransferase family 4 protein [Halorubrum sp. JWXQ-INN 858]MWV65239.1 glycosyltransferase [Halorubrum sp. JWXQ-INN 858]
MRPLRVAVLDPGGFTPPYTHRLCSALGRLGHDVRLFTAPSDFATGSVGAPRAYSREEFFYRWVTRTFEREGLGRLSAKGVEHVRDSVRLVAALERWRPDVVHVQWFPLPPIDVLVLERLAAVAPVVHTVHDSEPRSRARLARVRRLGTDRLRRRSARLIAHTEYTRTNLRARRGIDDDAIAVVPHGLLHRPRDPEPSRRSDGSSRGDPEPSRGESGSLRRDSGSSRGGDGADHPADAESRVLLFGSIKPYKGLDTLVRAVSHLPRAVRATTTLHVAGRARMDLAPITELAGELGVADRIEWDLGHVDDAGLRDAFDRATVVALPYRRIDQSGVLLTAIARGVPVVAADVGGFSETIDDGTHGHLVPPADPRAFGSALGRVLADRVHRSRLEAGMATRAREWPSWEAIAAQTVSVYRDAA